MIDQSSDVRTVLSKDKKGNSKHFTTRYLKNVICFHEGADNND